MRPIRNLNSVQAFLAVAECHNVLKASALLGVSQSSVSYHIKKLEDDLSVRLFERRANGMVLTSQGAILASYVKSGLAEIQNGIDTVLGLFDAHQVRVAMVSMFASRWLAPRLSSFWELHPEVHLSFKHHANDYTELPQAATMADFGIQWGRGHWPKFEATRLLSDRLVVVCSPSYLAKTPIAGEADVDRCNLLHVDDSGMWSEWFERVRNLTGRSEAEMLLEDRGFQLSATLNGLGLSLFVESFVRDELKRGTLVNPLGKSYETAYGYYLVKPEGTVLSRPADTFRRWILDGAASA
ncbi:MAG: LysR family transcriptional regulator [Rhodospirillales bacterium]